MSEQDKLPEVLGELLDAVAADLLRQIREGTATASDVANAIRLLKDNGVTVGFRSGADHPLRRLAEELPFVDPEDLRARA